MADGDAPDEAAGGGRDAEIEALQAERDKLADQCLRARAETSNCLKRAERDRARAAALAKRDLVAALLPALDALELAIRHGQAELAGLRAGVEAARDALVQALAAQGVERIPAEPGRGYDPDLHHVQASVERADLAEGAIVEELRTGWRVGALVARHGEVVVARRPAAPAPDEPPEQEP